jgi:hypothetical protein
VRNLLFPLLGKGPVFGGGGGGGGGGGDSGGSSGTLTTTASSKSSGDGDRYISIRDRFDGGGKGKPGSTFEGGPFSGVANSLGISPVGSGGSGGSDNDRSDPAPAAPPPASPPPASPPPASPPPAAPGTIAGFGQDYNDDGRITIGEVFTDMTDAGGAGGSGGVYSGGPLAGISNVVTGQFNPGIQDMLDGGGPGQSGPQFEGSLVGTAANALGLPPLGQGSGVVSGILDKILTPPETTRLLPAAISMMNEPMRDEIQPVLEQMGLPQPTTTAAPADQPAARVEPPPVSMGFLPPQMSMVGFNDVMSPTGSGSVAFDNYFMPIPVPQPPAPVPQPPMQMPVSDRFGMPLALSQLAPIRGPDLAQFFAPPAPPPTPMYTPAVEPRSVIDPRPVSGVTPLPGPTLSDPKGPGGTTGAIPPGGIGSLVSATPGVLSPIFGRQA